MFIPQKQLKPLIRSLFWSLQLTIFLFSSLNSDSIKIDIVTIHTHNAPCNSQIHHHTSKGENSHMLFLLFFFNIASQKIITHVMVGT